MDERARHAGDGATKRSSAVIADMFGTLAIGPHRNKMSRHTRAFRNSQVLRVISVVLCLMYLLDAAKAREFIAELKNAAH